MLYLILPPIIIVAALVVLVFFFSRRFPEVEKEIAARLNDPTDASHTRIPETMRRASLNVLEHVAQWFKVMTLRAHNVLHQWIQSLREKKTRTVVKPALRVSEESSEPEPMAPKARASEPIEIERRVRPMVSRQVTQPERRIAQQPVEPEPAPAMKNQLEDILVERIAANPRDIEAYERLGEYYMEQGNTQDAKECYRQVLRLSPVHRLAKIKIRRLEKMLEQK